MADTASLVARVKTDGAETAAKQLDNLAKSADSADSSVNKLTPDVGKLNTATGKASSDGLAKFRQAAGQVGFQVQDMVVQLQGGTSAFVAIGQQGSQLAGAFGPGGAVLGAVIALASAVGGVLYKSLTETAGSTKDLENAQKQLKETFQQTTSGTLELTDGMIQLTQVSAAAAETQLALAKANADLISQQTAKSVMEDARSWETWRASTASAISQYDALIDKGANVNDTLTALSGTYEGNIVGVNMLAQNIEQLSEKFGVNQQQALDMIAAQSAFNKQPTAENARKISDIFTEWLNNTKNLNPELIRLSTNANNNATALESAEKSANAVSEAQKNMGRNVNTATIRFQEQNAAILKNQQIAILGDRERVNAQAQLDKEAFAKREGVTKDQIDAYNKARDTEAQQDIARIDKTEKDKNDRLNESAKKREESAAQRAANEAQRQQKAADDFLKQIDRTTGDEIAKIDAAEQQKLDKLAEFQQQGTISAKAFEEAKTAIQLEADTARQEELDKRKEEQRKKDQKTEDIVNQTAALNAQELQLLDIQQKSKEEMVKAYYDQGLLNEEQYQIAKEQIASAYDTKRLAAYQNVLGQTTDDLKTALGEGNKAYKAFAIANAIMQTYQGATAAFQSAAAIPIVGWIAAPIAAAAAVAAGLANVAKIRSAREQGGQLAVGQASTIAERNKPEVIMPAGASRVRTAQQMRQIMGDDSGNNNANMAPVIINQTTGRIDSATTEKDQEGRLIITIRETVARDLQDSNSGIAKSRRSTRGLAGM